ncbi:hypothetical protein JCM10450v2_005676 [Rhodotorula kratochvilovae]
MARHREAAPSARLRALLLTALLALLLPSTVAQDDDAANAVGAIAAEVAAVRIGLAAANQSQTSSEPAEAALLTVAPTSTVDSTSEETSTLTATAAWVTKTAGGMEQYSDSNDTVVLHGDGSITYFCPDDGDEWTVEQLSDSLSAHTATGAGCKMEYAFTDGATGTDAGVFGCSVDTSMWNATGWWNGYGTSNTYKPYQGSCQMKGLRYDKHTIQLVNSPYQPGKVYFTGLRYTTNRTQQIWETHSWDACCAGYTFPDGVATTVDAQPSATSTATTGAGGGFGGMSTGTTLSVVCGLGIVLVLASVLIGCMCCKKRPAAGGAGTKQALRAALHGSSDDEESRPLRHKKARGSHGSGSGSAKHGGGGARKRHGRKPLTDEDEGTSETGESETSGTTTGESGAETEMDTSEEKGRKGRRRRGRR